MKALLTEAVFNWDCPPSLWPCVIRESGEALGYF